jgi:anti-sigma-K factor RskA
VNAEPRDDPFAQRLAEQLDRLAEQAGTAESAASPPAADPAGENPDQTEAVVAQLRAASTWIEPPADLRATVLARVLNLEPAQADREPADDVKAQVPEPSAPSSAPAPSSALLAPPVSPSAPVPPAPSAEQAEEDATEQPVLFILRRRQLRWAVPVAAAAAVIFTFSVLAVERALETGSAGRVTYVATGTALAPEAGARVSVSSAAAGFSVVIDAHDLPAAAPGSYYVAWLRGPRGTVPIGSVHARRSGRPITMWSGVDPAAYPTFLLTLQREGEPVAPSRFVVLTAALKGS